MNNKYWYLRKTINIFLRACRYICMHKKENINDRKLFLWTVSLISWLRKLISKMLKACQSKQSDAISFSFPNGRYMIFCQPHINTWCLPRTWHCIIETIYWAFNQWFLYTIKRVTTHCFINMAFSLFMLDNCFFALLPYF